MAIAPTGAVYKALTFDGVSSRTYGVYITGEAVYNAPKRAVEMISIPGRNGAFALDNGRFENIEVTYPAGIFADTETDFADAVSEFRNYLCSRNGYVRLTDEYNPNEYRMAVYKSGLEVEPALLKAGEFKITFECMPQRWLTSGETKVSLLDGESITNPTLFCAKPMLEVKGYGTISFNGFAIDIENVVIGEIETSQRTLKTLAGTNTLTVSKIIDYSAQADAVNASDSLYIGKIKVTEQDSFSSVTGVAPVITITGTILAPDDLEASSFVHNENGNCYFQLDAVIDNYQLTSFTDESYSATISMPEKDSNNNVLATLTVGISIVNTSSGILTITLTSTVVEGTQTLSDRRLDTEIGRTYIDSTLSILGNPMYIDCDLGNAYKIENGTVVGLNQHVDLGSNLPVLSPGANTIVFDNTVTELKVVPRWWKV